MADPVATVIDDLLECLCTAVNAAANPPAQCCVRWGSQFALDIGETFNECCDGVAIARFAGAYQSHDNFPDTNVVPFNCDYGIWAVQVELGIFRCAPMAERITCGMWAATNTQGMIDQLSLRQAICCFRELPGAGGFRYDNDSISIAPLEPILDGGCAGVAMMVTVQVAACDCA
jgi:hypothetical protein